MESKTWDETWMAVADAISLRSKCVRRQAGCVLVSPDNQLVSAGYNGPPRNWLPPYDGVYPPSILSDCSHWCPRAQTGGSLSYDDCPSVHSEPNALAFADLARLRGGTAYVTSCPCLTCAKNLSNSGIVRAVFRLAECDRERQPELTLDFFRASGIQLYVVENRLRLGT